MEFLFFSKRNFFVSKRLFEQILLFEKEIQCSGNYFLNLILFPLQTKVTFTYFIMLFQHFPKLVDLADAKQLD